MLGRLCLALLALLLVVHGAAKRSHYAVLGVDNKAEQSEIKKAYRRLAMKTHPDKGGDAEQFKRINEAYHVLSDTRKREAYDLYGEEPGGGHPFQQQQRQQGGASPFGSSPDPMSDMLNELLGSLFGQDKHSSHTRQQARPSRPVSQTVHCTLEELFRGCSKKYRVRGGGFEKTFLVSVKRGFKVGTKITFPPTRSFPLSVIFLLGEPKPHPLFNLRDDDLVLKLPVKVSRKDKLNGAEKLIPTLEGTKVALNVVDDIRSGVRRFDGLGMHKSKTRGGGRGCLVVKVEVAG